MDPKYLPKPNVFNIVYFYSQPRVAHFYSWPPNTHKFESFAGFWAFLAGGFLPLCGGGLKYEPIWVETWRTPRDIQKKYSNTQIEQAANILHARASRANILHVRATFYTPARRAGTEGRGQGGRGG